MSQYSLLYIYYVFDIKCLHILDNIYILTAYRNSRAGIRATLDNLCMCFLTTPNGICIHPGCRNTPSSNGNWICIQLGIINTELYKFNKFSISTHDLNKRCHPILRDKYTQNSYYSSRVGSQEVGYTCCTCRHSIPICRYTRPVCCSSPEVDRILDGILARRTDLRSSLVNISLHHHPNRCSVSARFEMLGFRMPQIKKML